MKQQTLWFIIFTIFNYSFNITASFFPEGNCGSNYANDRSPSPEQCPQSSFDQELQEIKAALVTTNKNFLTILQEVRKEQAQLQKDLAQLRTDFENANKATQATLQQTLALLQAQRPKSPTKPEEPS